MAVALAIPFMSNAVGMTLGAFIGQGVGPLLVVSCAQFMEIRKLNFSKTLLNLYHAMCF